MTTQIDDTCLYKDIEYSIINCSNDGMLDILPALNISPTPVCTACYKGYSAEFAIKDGSFILDNLHVTMLGENSQPITGPSIRGVHPTGPESEWDFFTHNYSALNCHIAIDGSLLLAE